MRKRKFNKKQKVISLVAVFAVAATGIFIYLSQTKSEATGQKIIAQSLEVLQNESLKALDFLLTATVEPKDTRQIVLEKGQGIVEETLVKEGDSVTKGQELFRYVNPQGDYRIREAELTRENQQKILNQGKENANIKWQQYNKKKADLEQARTNYNQGTAEEKLALKQEVSSQEAIVEQALAEARNGDMAVTNYQTELEKADITLASVKQENQGMTVAAEIDGIVKKIDTKQLNKENPSGEVFMEIQDTSTLYLAGTVDEFRKEKLALDQSVEVIDRGDSEAKWTGKVTQIGNTAAKEEESAEESKDDNPNLTKYPFKVALDASDAPPVIGKHVFVNVPGEQNTSDSTIKIPKEYVVKEKNSDYLWVVKNKKITKVKITGEVYYQDDSLYQIKSGVTIKDQVVSPMAGLSEGQEVGSLVKTQ